MAAHSSSGFEMAEAKWMVLLNPLAEKMVLLQSEQSRLRSDLQVLMSLPGMLEFCVGVLCSLIAKYCGMIILSFSFHLFIHLLLIIRPGVALPAPRTIQFAPRVASIARSPSQPLPRSTSRVDSSQLSDVAFSSPVRGAAMPQILHHFSSSILPERIKTHKCIFVCLNGLLLPFCIQVMIFLSDIYLSEHVLGLT